MKTYLLVLFLAALIQTAFLPINLCLLIVLARSFAVYEKSNFYMALFSGVILGILSSVNIGIWALIFLMVVFLIHLIRKLPITANNLTIVPISFLVIAAVTLIKSLIFSEQSNFVTVGIETLVTLPIFILVKIWEERFVVKSDIKLKLKG